MNECGFLGRGTVLSPHRALCLYSGCLFRERPLTTSQGCWNSAVSLGCGCHVVRVWCVRGVS